MIKFKFWKNSPLLPCGRGALLSTDCPPALSPVQSGLGWGRLLGVGVQCPPSRGDWICGYLGQLGMVLQPNEQNLGRHWQHPLEVPASRQSCKKLPWPSLPGLHGNFKLSFIFKCFSMLQSGLFQVTFFVFLCNFSLLSVFYVYHAAILWSCLKFFLEAGDYV